METTTLDLNLSILSAEIDNNKVNKPYVVVSLLNNGYTKIEKHKTIIDKEGSNNVLFKNVNVCTAALGIEVFSCRTFLPDKRVGQFRVLVSELMLLARADGKNQETLATYELVSSSFKKKKGVLNFSYKLCIDGKEFPAAVRSDDEGVFKMVPSYRRSLKSLDWC